MRNVRLTVAICALATAPFTGCAGGELDSTVTLQHDPIASQPWEASGEPVDDGKFCPSGDRENVGLAHPDGTPMDLTEFVALIGAAEAAGGSHVDVPRIGWTEHVCDDGSGSFVLRDEIVAGSASTEAAEVIEGTGAYANLSGSCVIELVTNEGLDVTEMTTTCDLYFGEG